MELQLSFALGLRALVPTLLSCALLVSISKLWWEVAGASVLPKGGGILGPGDISQVPVQVQKLEPGRQWEGAVPLSLVSPVPCLGLCVLKGAFIHGPCTVLCGPGV